MTSEFEKFVSENISYGVCFVQEEPFSKYFVDAEFVSTKFIEMEIKKLEEECGTISDKIRMAFKILKGSKQELENRLENIKGGCIRYIDQIHQENGKTVIVLPKAMSGGKSKKALKKLLNDAVNQLKFNILSVTKAMHVYDIFVSRIRYGITEIISSIEIHYNEYPNKFTLTTEPDLKYDNMGYITDKLDVILNGMVKAVIADINKGEIKFIRLEKVLELLKVEDTDDLIKIAVIAGTRANTGLGELFLRRILDDGYEREELDRLMEESNLKRYVEKYEN
ncbi:hypothetical protein K493DRAFT_304209 [Basidiobolus meristosporus CBS 931.73]|uniref:Uncharacterized protein n=1 Tax=Basidiobolus meristosporus CBS 931.73 TaxID=1314790 RepID=A0A1Y1XZQ0_9FUNG|nr:hypothetical protein K493DRAFT_304209 [Basidiobolus meristosporus CBS 931.73]|eukprot:ORX91240.1 hypothetical protein K493DRAFT_304209 [Basidiobolus meristosporus CBS 931.73]